MSKRNIQAWLLLLAVLVALLLRVGTLGRKSLWGDEVATLRIASQSAEDIIMNRTTRSDPHPPLYYLLMHYWTELGQSELVVRLPSALAGIAAIPLLYWLVRACSDQWSATTSAWLLAIMPLHIWYSQEARMYALVCTLGMASTLFYALTICRQKPLAWLGWIAATVTGLYTDYSMVLVVVAQIILLVPSWRIYGTRPAARWPALIALPVALLLSTPTVYTFVRDLVLAGGKAGYYLLIQSRLSGWGIDIPQAQLHTATMTLAAITMGVIIIAVYVLSSHLNKIRVGTPLMLAATAIYLAILIASAVPRGLLLKRQLLAILPYGLGGIAAVLAALPYRNRLLAALVLVTLPVTGHIVAVREQEAWRDVAQFVENNKDPQDIILFDPTWRRHDFEYYYPGDVPRQGVQEKDVPETLISIAASHQRVWLVQYFDPPGEAQRWLDENCTFLDEYAFPGVRIRLYDTRPPD
ncbi:MAG: glycosyltransferase family 39 protein [Anaerolineae bacterium]|nr:glycosyltransferase family 39 protein [Anaerolineae bacterium]